jgi:hypothetical protein
VDRSVATATAAGVAVFLGTTAFMVRPYLRIVEVDPGALRGPEEVLFFSPPLRSLLAAHPDSRAWGGITAGVRETVPWIGEQTLFPGLVAVVLAVVGLGWGRGNRPLRLWLAGATVVALLLSMGLRLWGGLLYEPLFEHAPGWQGMRTPGRLAFAWSLGIALLAALGADRVQAAVAAWRPGRFAERSAAAVAVVLAAVVAFEGSARMPLPAVPLPAAALRDAAPGPRLHLPSDGFNDSTYMLWSTEGFPRIANGSASYTPPFLLRLRQDAATFPDPASVQALRAAGLRSVVVHRDRIAGTPWESAADRPVEGLGIGRRDYGDVVVFDLDS